jgi:hypothetical protein
VSRVGIQRINLQEGVLLLMNAFVKKRETRDGELKETEEPRGGVGEVETWMEEIRKSKFQDVSTL